MSEFFVGQICLFPYDFEPIHFMKCDGRSISISQNQVLYALIGLKFGGSVEDDVFRLPNMSEPVDGMAYYICHDGIFPQRS